jgi:hypothetical protein
MGGGETDEELNKLMAEVPDLHGQALLQHSRPMKPVLEPAAGDLLAVLDQRVHAVAVRHVLEVGLDLGTG